MLRLAGPLGKGESAFLATAFQSQEVRLKGRISFPAVTSSFECCFDLMKARAPNPASHGWELAKRSIAFNTHVGISPRSVFFSRHALNSDDIHKPDWGIDAPLNNRLFRCVC